VAKNVKEP